MRKGLLGSIPALLAGAGLTLAQPPSAPAPTAAIPSSLPQPAAAATLFRAQDDDYQRDNAFDPGPPQPIHDNAFKADECEHCDQHALVWANLEYLLWTIRADHVPPLLTTAATGATGALGLASTQILLGGGNVVTDLRSGTRVTIGGWLQQCLGMPVGVEVSGFSLGKRSTDLFATSSATGSPVIARPIINALTGAESVYFVAAPGQFAGTFHLNATSELNGAELNAIVQPGEFKEFPDITVGIRYLSLNEDIAVSQTSTLLANGLAAFPPGIILRQGSFVSLMDTFSVSNSFYGGQIGTRGQWEFGRFYVNGMGKVALGVTQQSFRILGSSTALIAGGPATHTGGLLALASNTTDTTHSEFSVVPEVGINLGFQINKYIDIHAGYSFLYWSRVLRPGDFIDRRINPTQVPTSIQFGPLAGPALPSSSLNESNFWAYGLNAGMTFRY